MCSLEGDKRIEWMFFLGQTDLWHITFFLIVVLKKPNKMLFCRQIPKKDYVDQFMSRPANYGVLEGIYWKKSVFREHLMGWYHWTHHYDQIYVDFFWWRYLKSLNTIFFFLNVTYALNHIYIYLKSENNEYDKLHLQLSSHEKRKNKY